MEDWRGCLVLSCKNAFASFLNQADEDKEWRTIFAQKLFIRQFADGRHVRQQSVTFCQILHNKKTEKPDMDFSAVIKEFKRLRGIGVLSQLVDLFVGLSNKGV